MMKLLKKILRCLHPLNKIHVTFEFYEPGWGGQPHGGGFAAAMAGAASWNFDRFGEQIRDLIAKGKRAISPQLQVMGLEMLEAHFGSKWPKVVDNVHVIVQMVLKKHLGEEDASAQVRDNAYILLFGNASDAEARVRCRVIRDEIHAVFMEPQTGGEAAAEAARVGLSPAFSLGHKTEEAGLVPGPVIRHEAVEEASVPGLTIKHEEIKEVVLPNVRSEGSREQEAFDLAGEERLPKGLRFAFRPMVDAQNGALISFATTPACGAGEGYAMLAGVKNSKLYSELDCLALEAFQAEAAKKSKTLFVCPVHFNSISDTTNNMFLLKACPKLSAEQKQQLVLELHDVPAKLNEAAIKSFVDKLKPHCKAVMIRTDLYGIKKNAGALGIASLGADVLASGVPEDSIAWLMGKFTAQAKEWKLKSVVYGLGAPSTLKMARDSGFSIIAGDAVHPLVDDVAQLGNIALP